MLTFMLHSERNTHTQQKIINCTFQWNEAMAFCAFFNMMSHDDALCCCDGLLQHYYEIIHHLPRFFLLVYEKFGEF